MTIDRRTMIGAGLALAVAPGVAAATAKRRTAFPRGFLWGAATAGHQVEGNNVNSDTWLLEHVKPTLYAEPSGDAANSFALWPQDLDLVKQIGLNTYRFSLEWARIEPEPGMFSIAMLDHYKAMIEGCHQRGITPFVTFNHFTTPRWFAMRGAWTDREAPDLFSRFCDRAARHLAGSISYAATLNEPNLGMVVRNAFSPQVFAGLKPMLEKMGEAAQRASGSQRFVSGNTIYVEDFDAMTRTMIAAHRAGRAAIKAVRSDLPVGVTLAIPDDQPVGSNSIRDVIRAQTYGAWLEAARGDEFVGVQNYERNLWDDKGKVVPKEVRGDRNAAGVEVHPDSLANAVRYAYSIAHVPIIVTEHGVNSDDDAVRARLIPAALRELKKAMDGGVPVKGYIHWSLLDNFEWIYGYKHRYGLVAVDRRTFRRMPKPSSAVLGAIARQNALLER
jgi:beta-glucosidase